MENREILIANTKTQKKYRIMTDATTLAELKAAMDNGAGVEEFIGGEWVATDNIIDYAGMSFTEGISNTQLLDDSSQLPTNIKYKGQLTNNLVILLTNTKKNIQSGAEDRKTAYEVIKENCLQEEVKEEFGRNFTLVATSDLWDFINRNVDPAELEDEDDEEEDDDENYNEEEENEPVYQYPSIVSNTIYDQVKSLAQSKVFGYADVKVLAELLSELANRMKEESDDSVQVGDLNISKDDLNEMINKA